MLYWVIAKDNSLFFLGGGGEHLVERPLHPTHAVILSAPSPHLVRVRPVLQHGVELPLPRVLQSGPVGHQPVPVPPGHGGRGDAEHGAAEADVVAARAEAEDVPGGERRRGRDGGAAHRGGRGGRQQGHWKRKIIKNKSRCILGTYRAFQ